MSLTFYFNDPCPKCRKPIVQAEIAAHPKRRDLAVQKYHCPNCGPIKTKLISLKPGKPQPGIAA
jgi:ssDNA-binding Zn-finger/Zn-ribbon topoisomerase 1